MSSRHVLAAARAAAARGCGSRAGDRGDPRGTRRRRHALGRLRLVAAMTRTLTTLDALVRSDRLDFAGLEEPQQQRLHAQAHLADFVEEQRAACASCELSRLVAIGAGEAALDVPEHSDSSRVSVRPAQLTATNGSLRRDSSEVNPSAR